MNTIQILLGVAILVLGRKLFWLFLGAVGFLVGSNLVSRYLPGQAEEVVIIIAFLAGVLGALLAILLERIAFVVAGFFAGGYFVGGLFGGGGWDPGQISWPHFILGGVVGAVLVILLLDWALIILSSLAGAALISQHFPVSPPYSILIIMILAAAGIITQTSMMKGKP